MLAAVIWSARSAWFAYLRDGADSTDTYRSGALAGEAASHFGHVRGEALS